MKKFMLICLIALVSLMVGCKQEEIQLIDEYSLYKIYVNEDNQRFELYEKFMIEKNPDLIQELSFEYEGMKYTITSKNIQVHYEGEVYSVDELLNLGIWNLNDLEVLDFELKEEWQVGDFYELKRTIHLDGVKYEYFLLHPDPEVEYSAILIGKEIGNKTYFLMPDIRLIFIDVDGVRYNADDFFNESNIRLYKYLRIETMIIEVEE